MSITGISAASPAAFVQRSQNVAEPGAARATRPQAAAPTGLASQPGSARPPVQIDDHHQQGGGRSDPQTDDIKRSNTTVPTGTNLLNAPVR
jgi:hypothetical protein